MIASLSVVIPSSAQDEPSIRNMPPDSLRLRQDVCPFECCHYGRWTARKKIPVYAHERDTTELVAIIQEGATFDAITGNVFVERFGEVDVLKDLTGWNDEAPRYKRGDTLFLLDYHGEGYYSIWIRDTLVVDGEFFSLPRDTASVRDEFKYGVVRTEPVSRWWVRVRLADGTEGWIDMDSSVVEGSDACG